MTSIPDRPPTPAVTSVAAVGFLIAAVGAVHGDSLAIVTGIVAAAALTHGWRHEIRPILAARRAAKPDLAWATAATLADLGELTARWLEGAIPSQPGYYGPVDVDEDDAPGLTAALIACNRAGYVTVSSQAGWDGPGFDGAHWCQLAWVSGFADHAVAGRIMTAADQAGYLAVAWTRLDQRMPVTWRDGEPTTWDGWNQRRVTRLTYPGVPRAAIRQAYTATQLTIVDPALGRNTLWAWLRDVVEQDQATRPDATTRGAR